LLFRTYSYFVGYLLVNFIQQAVNTAIPFRSRLYPYTWVATEGFVVCFYALIVLELYRVILRDLSGIASLSRRYIKVTLGLAILVSLLLLGLEQTPSGIVLTFYLFERVIVFSLVIFVLLGTAFLAYYPVPLNRNVVVYSIGYAAYFLTKATGLFILTLGHYWVRQLSTVQIGVSTASLLFWLFALNPRGETRTVVISHKWKKEDEERLLSQLKAINASLLSTEKK
jgi:hypothetical protein